MLSVPLTKQCSKCREIKPLTEYHPTGTGYLHGSCKECRRAASRSYAKAKYQPKIPKSDEERDLKRRNALRRADQKYKLVHADRVRAASQLWRTQNADRVKEMGRQWIRKNRHKKAEYDQRRAARKASAPGSFTAEEWVLLCEKYKYRCLCCGKQGELTIDHVVPLLKGGSNDLSNLQPLCKSCNSSKGDKVIDYRT